MTESYIFEAVRTPRAKGRPDGGLHAFAPEDLVALLIDEIASRTGADLSSLVTRMVLGCVGQVGAQGGHMAHLAKARAGLLGDVATRTLNNYCVSGLSAIGDTSLAIRAGEGGLMLAGGVEMLSKVAFLADAAPVYTDAEIARRLGWLAPILGAELLASRKGFSKADLDAVTLRSHQRAAAAWSDGRYDTGVVAVRVKQDDTICARDEWIRDDLTLADLERRRPAFRELGRGAADEMMLARHPDLDGIDYVHSVSNTPGMSDGAALVLLGNAAAGAAAGLVPRARIRAFAEATCHPVDQFEAGSLAMEKCLQTAGLTIGDLDLIEYMEAFAAPPLAFERDYAPDMDKVNVNGGHLAMGHPMGATGAILTTTLLHELERRDGQFGLVVTLAGGGIGSAMIIERVQGADRNKGGAPA
ncbi:acetyl-CoA C-acyltransferase [Hyphomonas sp.]|uniref:acetyl-CoA C-acyltransferase n=1 Tax=Hyphomonas sp. TaxID=87 RepID=UPI0025C124C2|nr:acetyl-CoA C-acyltransferase [Hyphomonas sp.]